jgi:hypothetical protein
MIKGESHHRLVKPISIKLESIVVVAGLGAATTPGAAQTNRGRRNKPCPR